MSRNLVSGVTFHKPVGTFRNGNTCQSGSTNEVINTSFDDSLHLFHNGDGPIEATVVSVNPSHCSDLTSVGMSSPVPPVLVSPATSGLRHPPKIGHTAADRHLWQFSANLQASTASIQRLKLEFAEFEDRFLFCLKNRLQALRSRYPEEFPWVPSPHFFEAGSVRNQTYLIEPDLDMILVLNSDSKFTCKDGKLWFEDHQIQPAFVCQVVAECEEAVREYFSEQTTSTLHLSKFRSKGKTVFSFRSKVRHADGLDLEFDMLPAFLSTVNSYYLLESEKGELVRSVNESAARKIDRLALRFRGLLEMIRVLKLTLKSSAVKDRRLEGFPSCIFEAAIIELVEDPTTNRFEWWNRSTFTELFNQALLLIHNRLEDPSCPLAPPNDPSGDLLKHFRENKKKKRVFSAFLEDWQDISEVDLLSKLQSSLHLLTQNLSPPEILIPSSSLPSSPRSSRTSDVSSTSSSKRLPSISTRHNSKKSRKG